jgi:hypothetical protein
MTGKLALHADGTPFRDTFYPDNALQMRAAPDGIAWRKCCSECAFKPDDPQGMGSHVQGEIRSAADGLAFYCLHRSDEMEGKEVERVCASFAAINGFKRLPYKGK